jgi:DNA-binding response OmpR family regulator
MKSILAIEDDPSLLDLLKIHLDNRQYNLSTASDGRTGLDKIMAGTYDLILLDLMLPEIDGLEVCRQMRAHGIKTPVLMLTAKGEEVDKIVGLEMGADDYVVKPFSIRELMARIKAHLRRVSYEHAKAGSDKQATIKHGELTIEIEKRKVLIGANRVELSPKEFDLLVHMASNPGVSYSRTRLLNLIWGYEFDGFAHTVNSHINRLRQKIEPNMETPTYILTTWGIGYRFNEDL